MEKVKVEEAIGRVLATDVTIIIPGVEKGPLFKRGHIIKEGDLEKFLDIGRHYVWVENPGDSNIHEDDAATMMMEEIKGDNIENSSPSESKVKLFAKCEGILLVNSLGLKALNSIEDVNISTKKHLSYIRKGEAVAIGKVMPKEISKRKMDEILEVAQAFYPVLAVKPILKNRIALFPVGNEFVEGRKEETSSLFLKSYFEKLGQEVFIREILPDDENMIKEKGIEAIEKGANIVVYIGGMAVDPDDKTVDGIKLMEVDLVRYGIPVFPGQTFLISYRGEASVIGIPSSIAFYKENTSFNMIMPVLLSQYRLSKSEIISLAEGGFHDA